MVKSVAKSGFEKKVAESANVVMQIASLANRTQKVIDKQVEIRNTAAELHNQLRELGGQTVAESFEEELNRMCSTKRSLLK